MEKLILGIDVGGTAIKIGLITENGDIQNRWEIPTNTENKGTSIASDIWTSVQEKLKEFNLTEENLHGIGIGAPGFVNVEEGIVYEAVNIGWKNLDLRKEFKQWSNLPVYVANDANVAALGENWKGAGDQANNLIAVTIGTGVGGGIIANGTLVNGENGTGGEIGHITVDSNGYLCNCGRKGCLETITSATGIVRQARNLIDENPNSNLAQFYQDSGDITAKDVFDLAGQGDELCQQVIHHTSDVLGFVIANIAAIINPQKILIGGGVSKAGDQFISLIEKSFEKYALPRISEICEMKVAKLGNDAGMIGAAYLVKERL